MAFKGIYGNESLTSVQQRKKISNFFRDLPNMVCVTTIYEYMTTPTPDEQPLIQLAKVLSNPVRLRMLQYLESSTYAMCTSFTRMINVPPVQASRHLKKMLECGLVLKVKIGKRWVYRLNQEKWQLVQALDRCNRQANQSVEPLSDET